MEIAHQGLEPPGGRNSQLDEVHHRKPLLQFKVYCHANRTSTRGDNVHDLEKRVGALLTATDGAIFASLTRDENNITVKTRTFAVNNIPRVMSTYSVFVQEGVDLFRRAFPANRRQLDATGESTLYYSWPQAPRARPTRQLLAFVLPGSRGHVSEEALAAALAAHHITLAHFCRLRGTGVNICTTNDMLAIVHAISVPRSLEVEGKTVALRFLAPAPEQVATAATSYAAATGATQPFCAIQARDEIHAAQVKLAAGIPFLQATAPAPVEVSEEGEIVDPAAAAAAFQLLLSAALEPQHTPALEPTQEIEEEVVDEDMGDPEESAVPTAMEMRSPPPALAVTAKNLRQSTLRARDGALVRKVPMTPLKKKGGTSINKNSGAALAVLSPLKKVPPRSSKTVPPSSSTKEPRQRQLFPTCPPPSQAEAVEQHPIST